MSKEKISRFTVLIIITVILCAAIIARLFNLQIVNGVAYREQSASRLMRSVRVTAPRGEILDRYGRPLVTNRMGFNIVFQKEYIEDGRLNECIYQTIQILEQYGGSYFDSLPLGEEAPYDYNFPNKSGDALQETILQFQKEQKLTEGADGQTALTELIERYKIAGHYSRADARKIAGVRYEMQTRSFNSSTPYTFATDVSIEVVSFIREQRETFAGVNIAVEPIRENVNGSIASHILGRVGMIYKEEYDVLKENGYGMNDIIGKDGIEKILESYLKGIDGSQSIEQNIDGRTTKILDSTQATPGSNVILTIDLELQKTLEESLARTITEISTRRESYGASAGSAVVLDVNTGEVLAIASYPTFNQNTFNEDYKALLENKDNPMWNRAIAGQYAPGSTFKMLTGIAALESGVIDTKEQIVDRGVYRFYESSGYTPVCWIYDDYGSTHGPQNIRQAIENSCNYYFYEVGRRMGIDVLADYGKKFGLGEYTGIELTGEAKGIFASRAYRESIDATWYPGDTLQASIGQSDHLFTPVQLANYIATIANGGTRYKVHLVKEIKAGAGTESAIHFEPEIVEKIEMSDENYHAIIDGMRKVSETGTASNVFASYAIPVGGKTGTASVPNGTANALFVAFAPFDDPQIAIAIVVEHGGHGNYVAPIARDVITSYMQLNTTVDEIAPYNTLTR